MPGEPWGGVAFLLLLGTFILVLLMAMGVLPN